MTEVTQAPEWFARWEQAMRGEASPGQRFLAEVDPQFMEGFVNFSLPLFGREGILISAETREIVVITIQAVQGKWDSFRKHVQRAVEDGVPPKMIVEGLELASMSCGMGMLFVAAEILAEELEAAGKSFDGS